MVDQELKYNEWCHVTDNLWDFYIKDIYPNYRNDNKCIAILYYNQVDNEYHLKSCLYKGIGITDAYITISKNDIPKDKSIFDICNRYIIDWCNARIDELCDIIELVAK